ncbi:TetR/AcrR family transcriptional regulator [Oerskovia sp. NPDC057915]|uniref:TetR/AcrR family transcriptional regulator n=1 Tax=Oerskovia sp. NPDC057915 TaxID=3346280 RepID=UPI0036DC7504
MADTTPTRERIVETAFRLFLTQGYESTSTAQLVAATGLSKGAIYHHFRDKEEIRSATVDHFLLRYVEPPAPDESEATPPGLAATLHHVADSYARLLETVATLTDDPLAYHRFVLAAAPGLRETLRDAVGQVRDVLADAARTSQDDGSVTTTLPPERVAENAAALVEGAGLLWAVDPRGSARDRLRAVVDDHLTLLAGAPGS